MMYDYVKHFRWAKLKVGIVVTLALFIVCMAVMFAGNIEEVFSPKVRIIAEFEDARGLRKGAPVWFAGVEIGSVRGINFTTHQHIKVVMSISADTISFLKKDSTASILTLGLLGDKYVELSPGSSTSESLKSGGTIQGVTNTEIQDVVETSQKSIAKIANFVSMLENIIKKIEQGEGTISKFIQDPAVYDDLKGAIREISTFVASARKGKGTVSMLLKEDTLYRDMSSAASDVRAFAQRLKESEGTVNRLINDTELYRRFNKAAVTLNEYTRKIADSKGTLNRVVEDESLYENLDNASKRLNILLDKVGEGKGVAGSLISDEELATELKVTLRDLNVLIKDIREHPGRYFKFSLF